MLNIRFQRFQLYSSDKLYWEADFQPLAIFINMIHKN